MAKEQKSDSPCSLEHWIKHSSSLHFVPSGELKELTYTPLSRLKISYLNFLKQEWSLYRRKATPWIAERVSALFLELGCKTRSFTGLWPPAPSSIQPRITPVQYSEEPTIFGVVLVEDERHLLSLEQEQMLEPSSDDEDES